MATIPTLSASLLSSYYAAGGGLKPSAQAARLQNQGLAPSPAANVVPPWQFNVRQNPETALERIFSSQKLIDLDDPLVSLSADNETYRSLFALYRGLARMRELVDYAEAGKRADSLRGLIDRKFQEQVAQAQQFVSTLDLGDLSLVAGVEQHKLTSSVATPRPLGDTLPTLKGAVIVESREAPIPRLTGAETFTIEVATSSGSTSVAVDLAQVQGALNVENVAAYLNDRLQSIAAQTSVAVERHSETSYGLRVNVATGETLTLTPDAGSREAAVYVAGASGAGATSAGFLAKLDSLGAGSPETAFHVAIDTARADDARAVATDSQGFVYVVGASAGDMDAQLNGGTPDAYLRKMDAAGNVVWSRLLGSPTEAGGFAIAIDAEDNAIVAGQTRDLLTDAAYGGGYDSFVTKFDSAGRELWTRQAQPFADDAALALAVDASGAVFVAGRTNAPVVDGLPQGGGSDAYVMKLGADGALAWSKQFGGVGDDAATALAVDGAGSVYVAAESGGRAVVRKYADEASSQSPIWEIDLGELQADGTLRGLALGAGGAVYVAGATANAALAGAIAQGHSGGMDAFVARVDDAGGSASTGWISYIGSGAEDAGRALAVRTAPGGDEIYLAGGTAGAIAGATRVGERDAFVARLDAAGVTQWAKQLGGGFGHAANAVAFDPNGSSVVSRLGLPTGSFPQETPVEIVNRTAARAGQSFDIAVNGGSRRRIAVEAGDSLGYLAFKINKALDGFGRAKVERSAEGLRLTVEALRGGRIDIAPGPEGRDALGPLGLQPATLFAKQEKSGDPEADKRSQTVFALGFTTGMNVRSAKAASEAGVLIDNAMREIRALYQRLNPQPESRAAELAKAQISGRDAAQIANLQFALDRLSASQQAPPASFFSFKA